MTDMKKRGAPRWRERSITAAQAQGRAISGGRGRREFAPLDVLDDWE